VLGGCPVPGSLKRTCSRRTLRVDDRDRPHRTQGNVKRWSSGETGPRWTAAGMLKAERQFRRIIGYRDLAKLAVAIERDLADHTETAVTENPRDWDILRARARNRLGYRATDQAELRRGESASSSSPLSR
jgi:hypothetical protein